MSHTSTLSKNQVTLKIVRSLSAQPSCSLGPVQGNATYFQTFAELHGTPAQRFVLPDSVCRVTYRLAPRPRRSIARAAGSRTVTLLEPIRSQNLSCW